MRINPGKFMMIGVCVLGATLNTACKSDGDGKWSWGSPQAKESKSAVASMKETHEYLGKAALELEGTRSALDRLSTAPDLKAWLKEYNDKVAGMEASAAKAKDRWYDMKHNSQAYIEKWDQEIATTETPEVKEAMEARRTRVATRLDEVITNAQQLRDAYQPYLKSLKDLQTALALDLTPAGVKALAPAIDRAKAEGDAVNKELNDLGIDLDKLSRRMGGAATQPAPKV